MNLKRLSNDFHDAVTHIGDLDSGEAIFEGPASAAYAAAWGEVERTVAAINEGMHDAAPEAKRPRLALSGTPSRRRVCARQRFCDCARSRMLGLGAINGAGATPIRFSIALAGAVAN